MYTGLACKRNTTCQHINTCSYALITQNSFTFILLELRLYLLSQKLPAKSYPNTLPCLSNKLMCYYEKELVYVT